MFSFRFCERSKNTLFVEHLGVAASLEGKIMLLKLCHNVRTLSVSVNFAVYIYYMPRLFYKKGV